MYQILNIDCLEGLTQLETGIADLILIDAPYFDYKTGHRQDKSDKLSQSLVQQSRDDQLRVVQECVRILKDGKSFFYFTNWQEAWWFQARFYSFLRNEIVWDKGNWCLSGDTKVLVKTPSGIDYLPLSTIYPFWNRVELYTPNGFEPIQRMKITATIYKDISVSGLTVQASPEHTFPVKKRDREIEELPLKLFKKGSLIWRPMEYNIEDIRFSYEDGWFIGFYLAEGYLVKDSKTAFRFITGLHEDIYRDRIERYVGSSGTVWHTLREKRGSAITGVHSERLRNMLCFFTKGNRAWDKELILSQALNTSKNFRKGILDGFCDGDGCYDGHRMRMATTSQVLSEHLMVLGSTVGWYGTRHFYPTSGFGGKGTWTIDLRANTGSQFWIGEQALARIKRIHQVNVYQPMYDLQIEGGLFCINHGILTHNSAGHLEGSFGNRYEVIFLGTKGRGWTYKGRRLDDIWVDIPRMGTKRIHPTEKPVELYKKIIELSTDEGAFIIDPYLGSGASAIAALELKRNFLGYEIDQEFYSRIMNRIKEANIE